VESSLLTEPAAVKDDATRPPLPERAPDPDASAAPERGSLTFDAVYEEHVEFVWRSALRLGVGEAAADDVVQQVFLVVHRRLGEFEGRSSMKTWLFGILLRTARDHRRGVTRKSPHLGHEQVDPSLLVADSSASPFEAVSRIEASRIIDRLLESLEGDKRVVFVMAELEQMTAPEISKATGLAPKEVYSLLRAARTDFDRAAAAMRRDALRRER
jgi:RNA polymerase sigma-70 factor (ECF subfamily)